MLTSLTATDLVAIAPGLARLTVPTLLVWGTGDHFFDQRPDALVTALCAPWRTVDI